MTQNAQLVYHTISGMKITVKPSIQINVCWLEDEFQTVRLCEGSELDGSMNGNMAAPTVPMMAIQASAPSHQAKKDRLRRTAQTPSATAT